MLCVTHLKITHTVPDIKEDELADLDADTFSQTLNIESDEKDPTQPVKVLLSQLTGTTNLQEARSVCDPTIALLQVARVLLKKNQKRERPPMQLLQLWRLYQSVVENTIDSIPLIFLRKVRREGLVKMMMKGRASKGGSKNDGRETVVSLSTL